MKRSLMALALVSSMTTTAYSTDNNWENDAKDAWIDGKAESVILFNTNLNSFEINTDVNNKIVTLTGTVNNETEKDLAGELIEGIDGVESVNNELTVMNSSYSMDDTGELTDIKISAVVKSRLLFNDETSGTDISVDVDQGVVTLSGMVASRAEKELAATLAQNAQDVERVVNRIKVMDDS